MKQYDFRNSPKCPYGDLEWEGYYWKYPREELQYEQDYWGSSTIDPDGKQRDLQSPDEWQHQVEGLRFVINFLSELGGGKVIDVGCGPGYLLSALTPQWQKYGIDVSRLALQSAQRFASVKRGEFPELDYESEYFDAVVMNHVIEHVPNPVDYVLTAKKVLKGRGIFIVATPDFDSGCARLFGKNYRMLHDKGHISLFTSFSLIKLLEDLGFRILEVEFPFFGTSWFNRDNLLRLLDCSKISPPFYGNHIIVVAENTGTPIPRSDKGPLKK